MGVEGVIFFDPKHAWEFELRRKRGAHLFSKHRYLSAQMLAYLTDDLWLDLARRANGNFARLKRGWKQSRCAVAWQSRWQHELFRSAPCATQTSRGGRCCILL